jgi:hypothetical protein
LQNKENKGKQIYILKITIFEKKGRKNKKATGIELVTYEKKEWQFQKENTN